MRCGNGEILRNVHRATLPKGLTTAEAQHSYIEKHCIGVKHHIWYILRVLFIEGMKLESFGFMTRGLKKVYCCGRQ